MKNREPWNFCKTPEEIYRKREYEVELYFSHLFDRYGHGKVLCEVTWKHHKKTFTTTSIDKPYFDNLMDIDDYDTRKQSLYDKFHTDFEEKIKHWIEGLEELSLDEENE